MVTVFDAEPGKLVNKVAEKLKEMKIPAPHYVGLVKTGPHAQRPPSDENFWFKRCASILRQIYVNQTVGVERLRRHFGGRKRGTMHREHHVPAGGSTIRKALQTLEKEGLLKKEKVGRTISAKGRKLLDGAANECM